jgi:cytoskeleton protein RodZ
MMSDRPESADAAVSSEEQLNGFTQTHYAPLGEVLAEARKAKKFSQADASNYLRYSVAQVNALENNDFAALPQPMITRGFIRNYARYLDLDATPLLESYKARVPEVAPYAVRVKSDSYEVMDNKSGLPWLKYILGSIFILLFLLAWMLYVEFLPKNLNTEGLLITPEVMTEDTELVSDITLPPSSDAQINDVIPEVNEAEASVVTSDIAPNQAYINANSGRVVDETTTANLQPLNSTTSTALSTINSGLKPALPNQAAVASPSVHTIPTTLGALNNPNNKSISQASILVKADAWVQVTDASGSVIVEKIVPAGASESITVVKPFNVIIGNAKASSLVYAGKVVDLAPYTTENNVARIKLE